MVDSSSDGAISPFFKIPRELRDKVYRHIARESEIKLRSENKLRHARVSLYNWSVESCCLVSRQFRTEYLEQIERTMILEVWLWQSIEDFKNSVAIAKGQLDLSRVRNVIAVYSSNGGECVL